MPVIKSMGRKTPSFKQLLHYVFGGQKEVPVQGFEHFVYTKNIRADSHDIEALTKAFEENESCRIRRTSRSNMLYHEVISWNNRDTSNINTNMLKAFAKEYAKVRGNGLFVIVPHYHQGSVHLHAVVSGLEVLSGRALSKSKSEFASIKKSLEEFQKTRWPEIVHSQIEHEKKDKTRKTDREYQLIKRTGKESQREELKRHIEECLAIAANTEELQQLLKEKNVPVYLRGGRLQGALSPTGRKHRFSLLGLSERIKELERNHTKEIEMQETLERIRKLRNERDNREIDR